MSAAPIKSALAQASVSDAAITAITVEGGYSYANLLVINGGAEVVQVSIDGSPFAEFAVGAGQSIGIGGNRQGGEVQFGIAATVQLRRVPGGADFTDVTVVVA